MLINNWQYNVGIKLVIKMLVKYIISLLATYEGPDVCPLLIRKRQCDNGLQYKSNNKSQH